MMRLRLGGIEFVGDAGEATFTIGRDGIKGLKLGGVDVRREQIDRPAAHGAFAVPGFLTGRSISWSGWIETKNAYEQEHAMSRLSGLLADGGSGRLTFSESDTRWIDVMRAGEPDLTMESYGRLASYSFHAWAADPRMYGEVREFTAGQAAVQYGNFPARPQLVVSGTAASGYTVTGPDGRKVTVTKALTSGAPHTIDFAKGGLYIGGVRQLRAITVYQPWEVGPGLPGAVATVNNGVYLVQRVTDTYV
jgi:hypothetical protein